MSVVEIVLMRAKPDVSEAEMLAASAAAAPDMDALPGLLKRELLLSDDGLWVDVVHWDRMENAQNALKLVEDKPLIQQLFSLIDEATVQMYHLRPVITNQMA
jgi:hypothetical protein